jgi:signal transduction histidine kinase
MHELVHYARPDGSIYPAEESPVQRSLANLETIRVSNEVFFRKDGTSFPVEYVARPQIDNTPEPEAHALVVGAEGTAAHMASAASEDGKPVGVVVAFTDISERNALDRMKDEFISTVSHELRTPLTSLRAALGLVAGGALTARPEKMTQMMDIAIGNTDRLVRLVNDILDLERIGSGKAELHSQMCSMEELMQRTIQLQQTAASKANIRFIVEANGVQVYADPDRILQTLTNLVSNAIKFSPPAGNIASLVRLSAVHLNSEEALIEVQDHGRGIPSDKLQQIFERFKQVDASDSRAKGGTGLGLAICRSIVAQHGGHIWATSVLGEGATFHFTLPTHAPQNLR